MRLFQSARATPIVISAKHVNWTNDAAVAFNVSPILNALKLGLMAFAKSCILCVSTALVPAIQ